MAEIYLKLVFAFIRIGFCSFGGLTMIPVILDEMTANGWMTEAQVMDVMALAEITPGSMGINCATFVGYRIDGIPCALLSSLGVMVPSLTLCMLAAHFLKRLKGNPWMEHALWGIRPACVGMLAAVVITLSGSTFLSGEFIIRWNLVIIALITGGAMYKFRLSVPKTMLLAAVLGLIAG